MRCWHKSIAKLLPEMQLRSQWRELVAMAKDLSEKGFTNHLLINQIMRYDVKHFRSYIHIVYSAMIERGIFPTQQSTIKLYEYVGFNPQTSKLEVEGVFGDWHNKEYLRVCMANLYEKHFFGVGKSRISDEEWQTLLDGYKNITGEDYVI